MPSTCPACGRALEQGACGCSADPFPLDEFAPELAVRPEAQPEPAPAAPTPMPARPALEIVRPKLEPAQPPDASALLDPLAAADAARAARSRTRLPTGIRLVIGRRRKPVRRSPPAEPVAKPRPRDREAPQPEAPVAPAVTTARSHPELEAQARLLDATPAVAWSVPRPAQAAPSPSAPTPRAAETPAASTALAPRAPSPPPARATRPVRAERLRVRVDERSAPAGPSWGERAAAWTERASASAGSAAALVTGPHAAVVAAAIVLAGALVIAPPLAAALVACAALLFARREERAGEAPGDWTARLAWCGLVASAAIGALVSSPGVPAIAVRAVARPPMLALPLVLVGCVAATAASLVLARRFRATALASAGLPLTLVLAGQAAMRGSSGLVLATGALGAACASVTTRSLRSDALRIARNAWLATAAIVVLAVGALAPFGAPREWTIALSLACLAPSATVAASRLLRSYEPSARRAARALALAGAAAGAAALVLGPHALGLRVAQAASFLPLAALGHLLLARHEDRRHHSRRDERMLLGDGRAVATIGALAAVAGIARLVLTSAPALASLAVMLASLTAVATCEPSLVRRPSLRVVTPMLAGFTLLATAAALRMPASWLPAAGAALLAAVVAVAGLLARRHVRAAEAPWTWPALLGSAACLGGAVVACASGAWLAGGVGVLAAAAAPWSLRALPPDLVSVAPASQVASRVPRELCLALLALAPAAPLVALGLTRWTGPAFVAEAIVAWLVSRKRAEALAPLAALLAGSAALLPLLANDAGFVPGAILLAGWCAIGCAEATLAAREPWRGTRMLASGVAVGAAIGLAAWISAIFGAAAVTLLACVVVLQAADRIASDAVAGQALRGASSVAWLAGIGLAALQAMDDPLKSSMLLAGGALAALLVAALQRAEEPVLAAGLAGALALAAGCLRVGIPPLRHPAVYLSPLAAFLVAWGVLRAWRGLSFRGALGTGLFVLAGCVLVESHLPASPPLLRAVAAALAATMVAGGVVARHRAPVLAGAAALALEAAWVLGEAGLLVARHPLPGLTIVAALLAAAAAAFTHLAWRAGGRAPLLLAWTSDIARLREAWSRWS